MSVRPRFSLFRAWVEPSPLKKTNGERRGLLPLIDGADREDRKANIKQALFPTTVAVLFMLADQVSHVKNVSHSNSGLASAEHVSLALPPHKRKMVQRKGIAHRNENSHGKLCDDGIRNFLLSDPEQVS